MLNTKAYSLKYAYCSPNFKAVILIVLTVLLVGLPCADAAPENNNTSNMPYLQYQEPQQTPATSLFSTSSYIFSLLATFLVVLVLAYFTSRLVANKMKWSAGNQDAKIISSLSFGSAKGVYLVEIAGKYLILGVTEHSINLLRELSDEEEIEKIQGAPLNSNEPFDLVFRQQISSLQQISQKFPTIFNTSENDYNFSQRENKTSRPSTAEEDNREKR